MKRNPILNHRFSWWFLGFIWGTAFGFYLSPGTAHAMSDYSRQLDRLVTAVERVATILERGIQR